MRQLRHFERGASERPFLLGICRQIVESFPENLRIGANEFPMPVS
jgi:hypothetical protein